MNISERVYRTLKKRAEENLLSLEEMIEDIVRRSMVNYIGGKSKRSLKIDDRLVGAFSRERRGRPRRKR